MARMARKATMANPGSEAPNRRSDPPLSPADIARRLKISRRTVYRMIEKCALRATRIEGQWRIDESDLTAYLTNRTNRT